MQQYLADPLLILSPSDIGCCCCCCCFFFGGEGCQLVNPNFGCNEPWEIEQQVIVRSVFLLWALNLRFLNSIEGDAMPG